MPPQIGLDRFGALIEIATVENALIDGYAPPGYSVVGKNTTWGAVRFAAAALGVAEQSMRGRIGSPKNVGSIERVFGLKVDWSLYKPPPSPEVPPPPEFEAPQIKPTDRAWQLMQDEVRRLKTELREVHRAAQTEEIIRELIGRVVDSPRDPPSWIRTPKKRERGKPIPEVPIAIWSDFHIGEVVEKASVNGFNEFNMRIAEERIHRLVDKTIELCRDHHIGVYPGIVINLIGDMISGGIHDELKKTDEDDPIPCCLKAIDWLVAALARIAEYFKLVYIPGCCGNHGRHTVKPEFKQYYRKNWDWLILSMLQRHFSDDKRFHFDIRPSNDVHYRVYKERYLTAHGDMLGVRGGDGIIQSIGPIVRGEIKQAGQAAALGVPFDHLIIGHWHQRLWLPRVTCNGALKGFDEFAMKSLGAKPDRPTQALWFVHPLQGRTAHWDIYVDETPKVQEVQPWVSFHDQI